MDNVWSAMGGSTTMHEVSYTPGIDLTEEYVNVEAEGNMEQHEVAEQGDVPSGSRRKGSSSKGTSVRTKNFSTLEDETLCSAFLNVSKDPIIGVNQAQGAYWARITEYFHLHKKTPYTRTQSSLSHRWGDIQRDTCKFCGCYAQIERRLQSGKSEDDKVKDALQLYEGAVDVQFKFLHCWLILRNEAKWNTWLATMEAMKNKKNSTPEVEGPADPTLPPRMERPIGRDRAKKQRSSTPSSSSSACLEVLQKMSMDQVAYAERQEAANKDEALETASRSDRKLAVQEELVRIQCAHIEIQKEMLKLQKEDSEDRVMSLDVEKMAPWVRDYYIMKQKKIAEKACSGDGSGGPSGI